MAVALLINDIAGTITSSPGFKPSEDNEACKAAVPLLRATAYFVPTNLAYSFSKFSTILPLTNLPL